MAGGAVNTTRHGEGRLVTETDRAGPRSVSVGLVVKSERERLEPRSTTQQVSSLEREMASSAKEEDRVVLRWEVDTQRGGAG